MDFVRREHRSRLRGVEAKQRLVEMGPLETMYAKLALEYRSSGLLFAGVTVNQCEQVLLGLPQALRVLQKRHPILRCRLDSTSNGVLVFREDPKLELPIELYSRANEYSWKSIWENGFESQETKLGDPVLRVCFAGNKQPNEKCELMLGINHFACDGMSLSALMNELLVCIATGVKSSDTQWGDWEVSMDEERECKLHFSSNPLHYLAHNLKTFVQFIAPLVRGRVTTMPFTTEHDGLQLSRSAKHLINMSSTHQRMTELDSQALLQQCRLQGCTITSAISAAFLCGQSEALESSQGEGATLAMVFNTRDLLGNRVPTNQLSIHVGSMCTNLFPSCKPTFAQYSTQDVWALARTIRAWSTSHSDLDRMFYAKHNTNMMQNVPMGPNLIRFPSLAVSSWGGGFVLQKYENGIQVDRAVFAQNHRHVSSPLLSVNNMVSGKLCVVLLCPKPRIDLMLVDSMFDLSVARLQEMCSHVGGAAL